MGELGADGDEQAESQARVAEGGEMMIEGVTMIEGGIRALIFVTLATVFIVVGTFVARLIAPGREHETLPKWLAPTILLVLLAVVVVVIQLFY